jgi:hypothetical protein
MSVYLKYLLDKRRIQSEIFNLYNKTQGRCLTPDSFNDNLRRFVSRYEEFDMSVYKPDLDKTFLRNFDEFTVRNATYNIRNFRVIDPGLNDSALAEKMLPEHQKIVKEIKEVYPGL